MGNARTVLAALWQHAGGNPGGLNELSLSGRDPVLPSSFRVGTAAQAAIGAAALAAGEVHRARGGPTQQVSVDMRHAAVEFKSESHLRIDDGPAPALWDGIAGTYRCADDRWVRIHTNFAHHRDGILSILGCDNDRASVAQALSQWTGAAFETEAAECGMIASLMRDAADWDLHPQGLAVGAEPLLDIERIGDAPAERPALAARPLEGVRVLDLTRIIAGPTAAGTLAAHGADVLLVTARHLPSVAPLVVDTGRGKRACHIDLREPEERDTLRELTAGADLFIQGYRPGVIAGLGFSPAAVAQIRPGIIYVSLSAYGHTGPWADRRGFDSIVQTASGFNAEEAAWAGVDGPKPLPCQALDHASGHLMAFGAMMAMTRRMHEGGSWRVRVSLARTGRWIRELGRIDAGFECQAPTQQDVGDLLEESDSGFGRLIAVRHAAQLSATPAHWALPSVPLGTHAPQWEHSVSRVKES